MKNTALLTLLMMAMTGVASADNRPERGGVCTGTLQNADSVLDCEYLGKVTIRQIYEKNFHVVSMLHGKGSSSTVVIIKED